MSIDYLIQYPCKVRESVSDHDLIRMQKSRDRVKLAMDLLSEDPELYFDEANQFAAMHVLGLTEPPEQNIVITDLLADATTLEALSGHCKGCPANLRDTAFGCGGTIHHPIMEGVERWLVSRLPDDLKTLAGRILLKAIKDFRFDGAEVDADRVRKGLYAAGQPVMRKWNRSLGRTTWLSSSQVLHMLVGSGPLSPIHAKLVCWFLGFLDADMKPELREDDLAAASDASGVVQFKMFLAAAAFAGTNGYHLFLDA